MLIKITPDKERVNSILNLIKIREEFISSQNNERFPTIIAENYYEIIKELATGLLLLDGLKAIGENSHRETIDNLSRYKEFPKDEIILLHDLRVKRNKSSYEGKPIEKIYIDNRKDRFIIVIQKLKKIINVKLNSK